tara:strand:- start:235 stop:489 length:255 start_codon:yes stop_codon:yes gene_type:complete
MDESTIYKKLSKKFNPSYLEVENESHLHNHHPQSPKSGNSHFSITIKSKVLENLSRIDAQRKIYEVLTIEMKTGLHALRIKILS